MRVLGVGFLLCVLGLLACGDSRRAGGTTVETTNGVTVSVNVPSSGVQQDVGAFALRVADMSGERFCVTGAGGDTLDYALRADNVWVRLPLLTTATTLEVSVLPDARGNCPMPDSAAVFGADDGYVAFMDWGGEPFDGATQSLLLGTVTGEPQAYTLSAEVLLAPGLMGGEVLTVGNVAGFRMDNLESRAAVYGYASGAGPSTWNVISGATPIGDSTWIRVDLVVDVAAGRYELYFDGKLFYASTEYPALLSYDKVGKDIVLGSHATGTGNFFQGRLGTVSVATVARSAGWLRLSALQGRTGAGWAVQAYDE